MAESKKSSNKAIVILLVVIILLLIGGGAAAAVILLSGNEDVEASQPGGIKYETNVGVVKPNENLADKLKEGTENRIPLHFSTSAASTDGTNFKCVLGNPDGAQYDVYFDIYADDACTDEIYVSGLIAPGSQLEGFATNRAFPKGSQDVVLVVTQVEPDHQTLRLQTRVYITLNVT